MWSPRLPSGRFLASAIVVAVLLGSEGASADTVLAQPPVRSICPYRLAITVDDQAFQIPYCARLPLESADSAARQAVVVIHGDHRNATSNHRSVEQAARAAGITNPLIVTVQFLTEPDATTFRLGRELPVWSDGGWKQGDQSLPPSGTQSATVSSFTVVDQLLLRLGDRTRFPNLEQIVVAGHSAGGQFAHRYAAANPMEPTLRASGIGVRYVVASPSSYLYFDARRRVPGQPGELAVPSEEARAACPRYNEYRFGLDDLNRYTRAVGTDGLRAQYASRTVVFLLGGRDNDPTAPDMDATCAAKLQGTDRLDRGNLFFAALGGQLGPDIYARQSKAIVPDAQHSPTQVFTSTAGRAALFAREPSLVAPGS